MIRTQIYLTPQEHRALLFLARLEGQSKSEVIRHILDERLVAASPRKALAAAAHALGAWRGKARRKGLLRLRSFW